MKAKSLFLTICTVICVMSCSKNFCEIPSKPCDFKQQILSFTSVQDLQSYADKICDEEALVNTKSYMQLQNSFLSLWDFNKDIVLSRLTNEERAMINEMGLDYEPEDEIIVDPVFAKILNSKREVVVNDKIYRFVKNGVIIYDTSIKPEAVDLIDISCYDQLEDDASVIIRENIEFIRIHYLQPDESENPISTKAMINVPPKGLCLADGTIIGEGLVRKVSYGKGNGDANGFQKAMSSLFGTNVVAINHFDERHRMKLRTFSQDYKIYRSVGMTVRMQERTLGIWWRKKAQEFRYGWTAVECEYTYAGPVFPAGVDYNNINAMTKPVKYYSKPIVLFTVPYVDFEVTNNDIYAVVSRALSKNKSKIDRWLNQNPSYKSHPQSIYTSQNRNSYRMFYPQYEERATNDGREQINWDFNVSIGMSLTWMIGGGSTPDVQVSVPKQLTNVSINRGETYAAVKYNNQWRACVITTR